MADLICGSKTQL